MADLYDSEEELEGFNVTNSDLINEFNPDRPTFRQTKEDALYGMWARRVESGWRYSHHNAFCNIFSLKHYLDIAYVVNVTLLLQLH